MALEVGSRLGVFEVTGRLGEGGMGVVYRATDTTLNRDVALKVLPDAFATDPERLARFEREAKVLASLNHPNIAQIHGLEHSGDVRALVLELVEGPTLQDRISQGPIPLDEALPIARQIAEALEAAHEQGIVHRDLKPANVKVKADGTVKVLDFGLAKALEPDRSDLDAANSPTMTMTAAATKMGVIMGTVAYMSPEQARAGTADRRSDIWAFGVVLLEMLTGQAPFTGKTVSDTLALVLKREPDWATLPANTPGPLRRLLRRCLEKEPKQRLGFIGDARLDINDARAEPERDTTEAASIAQPALWQRPVPLALAALGIAVVTGLAVWSLTRPGVVPADLMRFVIVPPDSAPLGTDTIHTDFTISPDGGQVVYSGVDPITGRTQAYLRPIDQVEVAPLRGTEGGRGPIVSPDGEWVGFLNFSGTTMRKVSIFGGPPLTLAESEQRILGTSWGPDDQIIFGTIRSGLFRVPGGGGEPEPLTTSDLDQGQRSHIWPSIIPGREAVLFVTSSGSPSEDGQLAVLDLDTGEVTQLGLAGVSPHYVSTGHLVYASGDGSVRAVPFDVASLEVTGSPVPLLEDVAVKPSGAANFSISDNGRLVYGLAGGSGLQRSLVWVDRNGREEPLAAPPRAYTYPRLSPDGTRVALDIRDEEDDVWVWDLAGETLTRLTFNEGQDRYGHWTPDGQRIVFNSNRDGRFNLYWKAADGTGTAERLTESDDLQFVNAVTPDGTQVLARGPVSGNQNDLIAVALDGEHAVETVLGTEFDERNAALSSDGQWIAYESNASGRYEVYVRPFPDVEGGRWQVSTAGGEDPLWSPDGRELFYWAGNQLMVAPIEVDPSFRRGTPRMLFEGTYFIAFGRTYDVAPDGQRFLMIKSAGQADPDAAPPEIHVVLNWHQELRERVPVP